MELFGWQLWNRTDRRWERRSTSRLLLWGFWWWWWW